MFKPVVFHRSVDAVLIPDGVTISVGEGTLGQIVQKLGPNWTVKISNGRLVRVHGRDGDAIGEEVQEVSAQVEGSVDEEAIWDCLRTCYDPEIPVNIVELGLVYDVHCAQWEKGVEVHITMTLTAPGCGMGQVLADDVRAAVGALSAVAGVVVDLVFDPPWSPERMTEEARLELGLVGF